MYIYICIIYIYILCIYIVYIYILCIYILCIYIYISALPMNNELTIPIFFTRLGPGHIDKKANVLGSLCRVP